MRKLWTKIKASKLGKLIGNTLQTLPIVGTVVTNNKEDTPENPKGQLNLRGWDWYRIILGLGVGYVLYKGLLNMDELKGILELVGLD